MLVDGASVRVDPAATVVAGWTGRNLDAVQHHIDELAAIGVAPPSEVPLYYRVATGLLTQDDTIEVVGEDTSGEAEPLLLEGPDGLLIALASDHTDRALEAHSVALSKQACAKPISSDAWTLTSVVDRLDTLRLRSWIADADGDWQLYQDGTLAQMRPLESLLEGARATASLEPRAILCGTVPTVTGAIIPSARFRCSLDDPQGGRTLSLSYAIRTLPHVS
ncbi:MAG: DUF2848 domain-containing protein [Pseudomonadota bacterium]